MAGQRVIDLLPCDLHNDNIIVNCSRRVVNNGVDKQYRGQLYTMYENCEGS